MAKLTELMGIPYPSEGDDPWWAVWESFVSALDAALYAGREDASLVLFTAGYFLYESTGSTLRWTEELAIQDPRTGYRAKVAAQSISLAAGQVAYVTMPRNMTADVTLGVSVASSLPDDGDSFPLALVAQVGAVNVCVLRGRVLIDGVPYFPSLRVLEAEKLLDGTGPAPVNFAQFSDADFFGFEFRYAIQRVNGSAVAGRIGRVRVMRDVDGSQQNIEDESVDSLGGDPGITFTATSGSGKFGVSYTATATGEDAVLIPHSLTVYPLLGGLIPVGAGAQGGGGMQG